MACRLSVRRAPFTGCLIRLQSRNSGFNSCSSHIVNYPMSENKPSFLAISRTVPFRNFQSRLGSATYRLNTIFVGLEHVANGADKPANGAAVTWTKPANPNTAKQAADQARIFACSAATVFVVDVADQYISAVVQEQWLDFPESVQRIATKAETRPTEKGGAYSLAERAKAIVDHLGLTGTDLLLALLELLTKWRNATVHSDDRNLSLSAAALKSLTESKQHLYDKYSHFDIDLALENFSKKKLPVAKEITSLIAAAQNLFRAIDEAAIKKAAGSPLTVKAALYNILRENFYAKDAGDTLIPSRMAEFTQGDDEQRRCYLLKVLCPLGITYTTSPISAPVGDSDLDELLAMDTEQLIKKMGPASH
jgi:hypothetical protein